jgi:KipI family sensor histidine kinase inhibitor
MAIANDPAAPAPDPAHEPGPQISLLGTTALLFEPSGAFDLTTQRRIWWLARRAEGWPEIKEAVPGVTNLMLVFAVPPRDLAGLEQRLREAWGAAEELRLDGRLVELAVVYGGDGGPHLADVMAHTGLGADDIVALHTAPLYTVYALGSHPGYCYLGGMDPRIAAPRRKVPVIDLPGGSVSIGGCQTGVSASRGPSGWNTIGRTEMVFFDPARTPPALLAPGDVIRFRAERIVR